MDQQTLRQPWEHRCATCSNLGYFHGEYFCHVSKRKLRWSPEMTWVCSSYTIDGDAP